MQLTATCPYCKADVLSRLLPHTYWHNEKPCSAIFFKCPHCKEKIGFELKWKTILQQITPLEEPKP